MKKTHYYSSPERAYASCGMYRGGQSGYQRRSSQATATSDWDKVTCLKCLKNHAVAAEKRREQLVEEGNRLAVLGGYSSPEVIGFSNYTTDAIETVILPLLRKRAEKVAI